MQAAQSAPLGAAPLAPTPGFAGGPAQPAAQQYQLGHAPLPQWQPQQLPQKLLQQQVQSLPNNPAMLHAWGWQPASCMQTSRGTPRVSQRITRTIMG